jgi:hypothetical protein
MNKQERTEPVTEDDYIKLLLADENFLFENI